MELFNLKGKVAIITGGYGHLGSAMTKVLLKFNCNVVVAGRSKQKFENAFFDISNENLFFKEIDILDSDSINHCINGVWDEFGRLDILINNAHAVKGNDPAEIKDEDWSYTMEAVLGSVHKGIRSALPFMKTQGKGKIINIASIYGLVSPNPELYEGENCEQYLNPPNYGAAKAGIVQLTKYYANWLGKDNINVNCITPGPFPNPDIQNKNPTFKERLAERTALKRIGQPEDIEGVCVLLGSNAADFITGQNFVVDGGWTTK